MQEQQPQRWAGFEGRQRWAARAGGWLGSLSSPLPAPTPSSRDPEASPAAPAPGIEPEGAGLVPAEPQRAGVVPHQEGVRPRSPPSALGGAVAQVKLQPAVVRPQGWGGE